VPEPVDWSLASFDGNRRAQHAEFFALSFREKLERLEQMAEVARRLQGTPGAAEKPSPVPGRDRAG